MKRGDREGGFTVTSFLRFGFALVLLPPERFVMPPNRQVHQIPETPPAGSADIRARCWIAVVSLSCVDVGCAVRSGLEKASPGLAPSAHLSLTLARSRRSGGSPGTDSTRTWS
eukprot:3014299-Pyramimonas_sp.AAC.1